MGKMQAMKVEKDNACDRCDVCEEASKVAKVRAAKAEDEVAELAAKSRQLETELDLTTEKLGIVSLQLEEKEKSLLAAEAEMNALNRRVSGLEEDLENLLHQHDPPGQGGHVTLHLLELLLSLLQGLCGLGQLVVGLVKSNLQGLDLLSIITDITVSLISTGVILSSLF